MAERKKTAPGNTGIPAVDFGRVVIDSPLRFLFQSSKKVDEIHMVDLEENKLSGECSCEDFTFRIGPGLRSGLFKLHTREAQCKHIRQARQIVATAAIRNIAKWLQSNRRVRNMEEPE